MSRQQKLDTEAVEERMELMVTGMVDELITKGKAKLISALTLDIRNEFSCCLTICMRETYINSLFFFLKET